MRGAGDFRSYSNQRLRLPNERPPLSPRIKRLFGAALTLAILAGIGVGVYFGVTLLLDDDESATAEVAESGQVQAAEQTEAAVQPEASAAGDSQASASPAAEPEAAAEAQEQTEQAQSSQSAQAAPAEPSEEQAAQTEEAVVAVASIEPRVAEELVTPASIEGAEIVAERATAEPVPSGIPRALADGAAYDPSEPATVFTSRWPVGTTLRLTRLPGATLLTDEEQAEVVGTEALVVVRGTESSNTDLQLSPAAFDRIAFYGTERIIAVRVEVTAPPP